MSKSVLVEGAKLRLAASLAACALLLQVVYVIQLQNTNAYLGYRPYVGSLEQILTTIAMIAAVVSIVPHEIKRPSDFFVLFYGVIVLMSCSVFNQVTGTVDSVQGIALFLTLLIPVFAVLVIRRVAVKVPPLLSLPPVVAYGVVVAIVGFAIAFGLAKGGEGGFAWDAMYERRLEGRDQFEARSAGAYLLSMAFNGLTPFVAFIGGTRRNVLLIVGGVAMGSFAFWLLGLKAPFVMALLFVVLGHLVHARRIHRLPHLLASSILAVCALSIGEVLLFEHSFTAEMIVRRAFVVQGALQTYYYDVISRAFSVGFEPFLLGLDFSTQGVAFFVGSEYQGNPDANANTNAFLVAFAANGLVGFVAAVLFVSVYCSAMDALYRSSRRPEVLLVVSLYSLLVTEQSFTVAFVSSGVGLLTLLVLLIRRVGLEPALEQRSARVP